MRVYANMLYAAEDLRKEKQNAIHKLIKGPLLY